jgi:hypothetical protein
VERTAAHRDDPLRPPQLGGEHTEEADCAVADDRDGHARLHVGRLGGEPPGAHHVGQRQQARDQVIRRNIRGGHQGAVREREVQALRLRAAHELLALAGRMVARLAVGTGVVGREERADDELAGFDRGDRAADILDDAAVLVPHRGRLGDGVDTAVIPQVGPAHARGRDPDEGIRRLGDRRCGALLETHIARAVENGTSHG